MQIIPKGARFYGWQFRKNSYINTKFWFPLLFVCLSGVIPSQSLAQKNEDWKARFLAEAPQQWEAYRLRGKNLQGECIKTFMDLGTGQPGDSSRLVFKQGKGCASFLSQKMGEKIKSGTIDLWNPRYAFQLKRATPEAPWAVTGVDRNPEDAYDFNPYGPLLMVQIILVDKAITFTSRSERLPELLTDPSFSIKRVTPVARGNTELAKVEFENTPKMTEEVKVGANVIRSAWNPLKSGWFILDPAHFWVMREFETAMEWQDHSTGVWGATFSYKEGEGGFPILSKHKAHYKGRTIKGVEANQESTYVYDLKEDPNVPESEFTMTAFGFPEPVGMEKGRWYTQWYIVAALAGFLCLAAGIIIHRFRREV